LAGDRSQAHTDSAVGGRPFWTAGCFSICGRIIGILRRELLDRVLIVNEHHLRRMLTEYLLHQSDAPRRPSASSP